MNFIIFKTNITAMMGINGNVTYYYPEHNVHKINLPP